MTLPIFSHRPRVKLQLYIIPYHDKSSAHAHYTAGYIVIALPAYYDCARSLSSPSETVAVPRNNARAPPPLSLQNHAPKPHATGISYPYCRGGRNPQQSCRTGSLTHPDEAAAPASYNKTKRHAAARICLCSPRIRRRFSLLNSGYDFTDDAHRQSPAARCTTSVQNPQPDDTRKSGRERGVDLSHPCGPRLTNGTARSPPLLPAACQTTLLCSSQTPTSARGQF